VNLLPSPATGKGSTAESDGARAPRRARLTALTGQNPGVHIPPADALTILAHRGGMGPWRENTLEAMAGARRAGADGVELDVRRCGDGALVVHHDPVVAGLGELHTLAADQLPSWVPTLVDVLEACHDLVVNVEIKNHPGDPAFDAGQTVTAAVVDEVRRCQASTSPPGRIILSCFWPDTLEAAAAAAGADPGPELALLVHPALDPADAVARAAASGWAAVNPHVSVVSPGLVADAHHAGLAVWTWTANTPEELVAVTGAGVDGVITDHVTVARRTLGR
jgi:glycerophosphoryl diester phosphodiesterase